jgi:hypothetical protein
MDTMEIAAFVGKYPEFRPADISQLVAAYNRAWRWLRSDYDENRHLLSVFGFGKGDYAYITKEREWQQTTTFFAKIIGAEQTFSKVLHSEGITSFSDDLKLPDVDRYVSFRNASGRQFGVWVVRNAKFHFALPFVTGPKAATSDYEPAPDGFPGFAVPVEQIYPCLTSFLELQDGSTIAAADGADEIYFAADGSSVRATWKRWVVVGGKAGQTIDSGLTSEVAWTIERNSLRRSEAITASKPIQVRRFWVVLPSTASLIETSVTNGARVDLLLSRDVNLEVHLTHPDWPMRISSLATGNEPLGRGSQAAIPLHLILESNDISFLPGARKSWEIDLSPLPGRNTDSARY